MTLFRPERRSDHPTSSLTEMMRRRLPATHFPASRDQALTHSAVYECIDLIADLVSGFPVGRFRTDGEARVPATTRAPAVDNPSVEDDPVNWRRIVVASWLSKGFAAGLVTGTRDGYPTGIELVDNGRVSVKRARPDEPWTWLLDGHEVDRYPSGPLWIAPGKKLTPGDPLGRSVLEFAAIEAGIGLAARKFGGDFFATNAHPSALFTNPQAVNEDMASRVKRRFLSAIGPDREPLVMGGGWKYEQIQISPNESQFLETIKANRTMVAGFFKVPPGLIGAPAGDGMTYKNVEHDGINLLRFCVQPWVTRMESTLNQLTVRPEFVKLNMDSLLRPDLGTRYRAHDMAIRAGFKSVNDVRRIEDLPPIPDGDDYLWPPYRSQLTETELQHGADGEDN